MKRLLIRMFFVAQLILVPFFISGVFADPPNPPSPGPTAPGPVNVNGLPVGAPIDDGMVILLVLGIAYGGYQIYRIRRSKLKLKEVEPF